jgi:hypothetical protein
MNSPTHDQIAQLARQLWESHGQPDHRSDEFWLEAERQLSTRSNTESAMPPVNPERLKAEAAAESVTDNYLSPAPSQQDAIKAAMPNANADTARSATLPSDRKNPPPAKRRR